MKTDPRVYECLSADLAGKPKDVVDRFSNRIAVFSDTPERLNIGEGVLKSKLWDILDGVVENGNATLFTGISSGADSAAAEFFTEVKNQKENIRIVHIHDFGNWFNEIDPHLRGFAANTLIRNTDYTKTVSGKTLNEPASARDHFIIDHCLHIVFLMDMTSCEDESYAWQLFDYATRSHKNSISHQIHIISCTAFRKRRDEEKTSEPVQGQLF